YLARCGLLFQGLGDLGMCFRERLVLLLEFLEQPDVLDGNPRLIGEGLEEGDLCLSERTHVGTPKIDCPDYFPFSKERTRHYSPVPELPSQGVAYGELLGLGLEISHVNGPSFQNGTACDSPSHHRNQTAHWG